jgi:magnesium chelatase family protein
MDRIDLFVKVDEVRPESLLEEPTSGQTKAIRTSVANAHLQQRSRGDGVYNSELSNKHVRKLQIEAEAKELLDTASDRLKLSPRAYFRVLRVARTIADLNNEPTITASAIAESLQFRENLPISG